MAVCQLLAGFGRAMLAIKRFRVVNFAAVTLVSCERTLDEMLVTTRNGIASLPSSTGMPLRLLNATAVSTLRAMSVCSDKQAAVINIIVTSSLHNQVRQSEQQNKQSRSRDP